MYLKSSELSSWQKGSKVCRPAPYSTFCFQAVLLSSDLFQTSGFHSPFQIYSSALSGACFHAYGCLYSTSMLFLRWDGGHTKICYAESTQRLAFSLRMQLVFLTFQSKSICTQKYQLEKKYWSCIPCVWMKTAIWTWTRKLWAVRLSNNHECVWRVCASLFQQVLLWRCLRLTDTESESA